MPQHAGSTGRRFFNQHPSHFSRWRSLRLLTVLGLLYVSMWGCGVKQIMEQTEIADNTGQIAGSIERTSPQKGPVIVLRFRNNNGIPELESRQTPSSKGDFKFTMLPGNYFIAAFIDVNKDGRYQRGEHGNYFRGTNGIPVSANQIVYLAPLVISGEVPKTETGVKPVSKVSPAWKNIGQIVTLADPRFTRDNYGMGLWRPIDFMSHGEGGLFFLEAYNKNKTPVIFVHGVNGGPTDWESVIDSLDTKRFQPWVLYYPSGLRLDMISDYLLEAVTRLQNKHGFTKLYVIAHSMGGLVTRSFVKKYVQYDPSNLKRLRLVMTINSPMAGMPAATTGVKHSPVVIPSWRDVEPASEFLSDIHTWHWPHQIPYHLVASFTEGESGDGVVPLDSQLPLKLQAESTRLYVFYDDHVGTLHDKKFLTLFNKILTDDAKK
jgi:pimeloyl-ACP methyl ester carboxylesterase